MVKPRGKQRQIKLALLKKAQTTLKKCPQKSSKCWKRTWFLIRRRYNIYSVSPGMRLLSLLSSLSSMLMLNFQNFYITKGPTTSAGEIPSKYKIRARERFVQRGGISAAFTDCARRHSFSRAILGIFFFHSSNSARKSGYWIARMSATFPGLVHDAEVFKFNSYHLTKIVEFHFI